METARLMGTPDGIAQAAALWRAGALTAFPTETVYGLGADARNDQAVAAIYAAKGRPSFNPLIVHVANVEAAQRYVHWSDAADRAAKAFWPGPLTLVLPRRADSGLSLLVSAGLDSVAIRVPGHPVAQDLLKAFGGPIAGPSANLSGTISPTTADHVLEGLNGKIDAVVDGGACDAGIESTILGLLDTPRLLRPGHITPDMLEAALGTPVAGADPSAGVQAPGQLLSHYAPNAQVRLNATEWQNDETRLGFGPVACDLNLSEDGDLVEAAANLFAYLRALDNGVGRIAVSPIPQTGLGVAINDRLHRAAAPR